MNRTLRIILRLLGLIAHVYLTALIFWNLPKPFEAFWVIPTGVFTIISLVANLGFFIDDAINDKLW